MSNPIERINAAWAKFDEVLDYTIAQTTRELQIIENRRKQNEQDNESRFKKANQNQQRNN